MVWSLFVRQKDVPSNLKTAFSLETFKKMKFVTCGMHLYYNK